jgi:hypothetical protein
MSILLGADSPVYQPPLDVTSPALDSNLRFFGGMGLGLGVALLWIIPTIERRTTVFRVIWLCAFLGGLGRLYSWAVVGAPPMPMLIFTLIEVPLVPVLIVWQSRVAQSVSMGREAASVEEQES